MKHKHADLIHAWADGAIIQFRTNTEESWIDADNNLPVWLNHFEYRIKPEEKKPVVRWLWAGKENVLTTRLLTEKEIAALDDTHYWHNPIKLEWSRTEFPE